MSGTMDAAEQRASAPTGNGSAQAGVREDIVAMGELFGSLAAARMEFGDIVKNKTASVRGAEGKASYTYPYADLSAITDATATILAKHGLATIQEPEVRFDQGGKMVVTVHGRIVHKSGAVYTLRPLSMPVAGYTPQAIGSAISYGRRYQITSALNLAAGDDDGAEASGAGGSEPSSGYGRTDPRNDVGYDRPANSPQQQQEKQQGKQQAATRSAAPPPPDPEAKGSMPHERCWGIGMSVFGPDWAAGARPWVVEKWTIKMNSNVRTSMKELNDDEKDTLGDYMNEHADKIRGLWLREKAAKIARDAVAEAAQQNRG